MRKILPWLFVLIYLLAFLVSIYLAFKYPEFRIILYIFIVLQISVYLRISYLRYKRNSIDLTNESGKKEIERLNEKINFWNGRD